MESDGSGTEHQHTRRVREAMATSEHGAPTAGKAVGDVFDTDEIFERLIVSADDEFSRSARLLFLSGLAAGLTIALTFIGHAVLLGIAPESELITYLFYPVGFIFIALGRYHLFTEETLAPVALVLARIASLPRLLRIWSIVFVANLLGATVAAYFLANTGVFDAETQRAALEIGQHALEEPWADLFYKSLVAGWLVAGMVWLIHAVREAVARVLIIYLLMFMIPVADLYHCIVGSTEVLYLLFAYETTAVDYLWQFLAPVTLGNVVGGVGMVALLNYGQTRHQLFPERGTLSWKAWLLGGEDRHANL